MTSLTLLAAQDVSQRGERYLYDLLRDGDGSSPGEVHVVSPASLLPPETVVERSREVLQLSRLLCWRAHRICFKSRECRLKSRECRRRCRYSRHRRRELQTLL